MDQRALSILNRVNSKKRNSKTGRIPELEHDLQKSQKEKHDLEKELHKANKEIIKSESRHKQSLNEAQLYVLQQINDRNETIDKLLEENKRLQEENITMAEKMKQLVNAINNPPEKPTHPKQIIANKIKKKRSNSKPKKKWN